MQSVRADDQIEITLDPTFESDANALFELFDARHRVAKNRLYLAFDPAEYRHGEIPSGKADITAPRQPGKYPTGNPATFFPRRFTILTS